MSFSYHNCSYFEWTERYKNLLIFFIERACFFPKPYPAPEHYFQLPFFVILMTSWNSSFKCSSDLIGLPCPIAQRRCYVVQGREDAINVIVVVKFKTQGISLKLPSICVLQFEVKSYHRSCPSRDFLWMLFLDFSVRCKEIFEGFVVSL